MKKIELEIVALSSSASPTLYYAVVLGEINGLRRLPIVIGAPEAQAIVVALEKIKPTRPLTHDLFFNFMSVFDIELQEVLIHKLEEGVFFASLFCKRGDKTIEIDSRTSDALALAVRAGCPVYAYEKILEAAGMLMNEPMAQSAINPEGDSSSEDSSKHGGKEDLHKKSIEELNKLLKEILEKEDYMKAVAIRDEIKRRKNDK